MRERPSSKVAFVTEAGKDIGYGHLYRSISISESFIEKGYEVVFYCTNEAINILNKKLLTVTAVKLINLNEDYQKYDIIIFDVYHKSFGQFTEIIKKLDKITTVSVIDHSFKNYTLSTDYIFEIGYQNYRHKIKLKKYLNNRVSWIHSGTDFLIFRKEFINVKSFDVENYGKRVLVTMGGSDPFQLSEFVSESLEAFPKPLKITYIIGGGFGKDRLIKFKKKYSKTIHSINILEEIDNMAEIMLKHDVAIINGGNTRFELASLGVPFISIAINKKQKLISDRIAKDGIGISLDQIDSLDSNAFIKNLSLLLVNFDYRYEMSKRMKNKIKTEGTHDKIVSIINENQEFREIKDSELDYAYKLHCQTVEEMLKKGIRQWLRPVDFEKLENRQKKKENYGLFINDELQVFLSLIYRKDYHEWTNEMPYYKTYWLSTISANINNKIRGIGKVAIELAFQRLKSKGIKELYLDCVVNQGFLVKYYKELGFVKLKQKTVKYRSGEFDVALMKKKLE